jgi:hypothetical protein
MAKLDDLLAGASTSDAPLDAVRAALQAELKQPPGPTWKKSLLLAVGACWGLMAAFAGVLLAVGAAEPAVLRAHLVALAGLPLLTLLSAWLALAPLPRRAPLLGAAAGALGVALLAVVRGDGLPGTAPEWVCTATHLGAGVLPLFVMLAALKRAAPNPMRALSAGLAVGTTGALIGELACGRGWLHVLEYHVSAWVVIAAVCVLIARRQKPISYAP